MKRRGSIIVVSQASMNRMYHGTRRVWEALRDEGAVLVVRRSWKLVRIPSDELPHDPVVGIDIMEDRERFLSTWRMSFVTTIDGSGEPFRVKEAWVEGLPRIIAGVKL